MSARDSEALSPIVRRLALAQSLSLAGRGAAMTALIWLVYQTSHSSWWVSGSMLAIFAVSTLLSPWTGYAGDRYDRRRVVLISSWLAAAAYIGCFVLSDSGLVAAITGMMVAAACTQGALGAAVQGAVPNLVADDALGRANSLVGAFRSLGYMLGPGVGGALLAVMSPAGVFLVSAAIVAAAVVPLLGVRGELHAAREEGAVGSRLDGYRQLLSDPWLRTLMFGWTLVMAGVGPVIVAEVVVAQHFDVGSVGYGLIAVLWDGGGIAGALLGRHLSRRFEAPAVIGGSLMIGVGFAVVGLTPVFWPVLVGMLLAGSFDSLGVVAAQNIIQRRTPDIVRSRVSAALDAVQYGVMALSFALGAPLIQLVGAQGTYLVSAAVAILGAVLLVPLLAPDADAAGEPAAG